MNIQHGKHLTGFTDRLKVKVPVLNLKRLHNSIKDEIYEAFDDVFSEQHFILGKQVKQIEERVFSYIGTKYAVGVASGTDALLLALKALSYKIYGREYFKLRRSLSRQRNADL